jgi:hypothetical protein
VPLPPPRRHPGAGRANKRRSSFPRNDAAPAGTPAQSPSASSGVRSSGIGLSVCGSRSHPRRGPDCIGFRDFAASLLGCSGTLLVRPVAAWKMDFPRGRLHPEAGPRSMGCGDRSTRHRANRDGRGSPRRAGVPWRGAATARPARSWSSCAAGIHVFLRGGGDSVGTCASASDFTAPACGNLVKQRKSINDARPFGQTALSGALARVRRAKFFSFSLHRLRCIGHFLS